MSFTKTKLAKAVAIAMAGSALSVVAMSDASAATTTMYNLSTGYDGATILDANTPNPTTLVDPISGSFIWALSGDTDGWANGANTGGGTGSAATQAWAGTASPTTAAFGYNGAHLNWGLNITGGQGGTAEISTFDSKAHYGVYADIDTAKGAWSATNTGAVFGGWRHDLDVGLFKTDKSGLVTLTAQGILQTNSNFGFTIFQGVDSVTNYGHHGQWNNNNNAGGITSASAFGGGAGSLTASSIVAYSVGSIAAFGNNPTQNLNSISFNATAGQIYTIALGGYRNGDWTTTNDGYKLTVSQVPVPGAVWLFGSAMAGLVGFGRRKSKIAA